MTKTTTGRPPMDPARRRVPYSLKLAPEVLSYLRAQPEGKATATVERAIKGTAAFKRWQRDG